MWAVSSGEACLAAKMSYLSLGIKYNKKTDREVASGRRDLPW